ncbi:hypothetical protein RND71_038670 [Anisodus tanguticus]|uniref:Transposase MuDR plant domain-containing protein n=1 Tax=Anisodus tanguticus TaxID=243964 RepID=A0AAE1QZG8_9SOLA|nr:hypothetical protein RND71_038670 [Anisodus tanguticus]
MRSRATCKVSSCKWFIFASKANPNEPFNIKTIGSDLSYGNQRDNKTIDSGFLAKKYVEEFRNNPSWGVKEFQAHVSSIIIESATSMQANSSFVTEQIVNQLKQPRVPQQQLRSSTFILEEIGERSREDIR